MQLPVRPGMKLAILLDYDGTVAPIAARPEDAVPLPGMPEVIRQLASCREYRVALVSGRPVEELRRWVPAGPVLVGVHGAEWLVPGVGLERLQLPERVRESLEDLHRRLREIAAEHSGFLVEYKGVAVALHYRLAGEEHAKTVLTQARELIAALMPAADWAVVEGRKVLEVRPRQVDKGEAVRRLCARWPSFTPLYFGDDRTDEDAFAAVNVAGGISVLVAERPRPTAAHFRVPGPDAVARFLKELVPNGRVETGDS